MRHPLVIVVVCYLAGLLLAGQFNLPLASLIAAGLGLALIAALFQSTRRWSLPLLIVFAGWANLTAHQQIISPQDLRLTFGTEPEDVVVRGRLLETPSVRMYLRDEEESYRTLAVLEVTSVQRQDKWLPAKGRMMTLTGGSLEDLLHAGTEAEVRGIVSAPPLPTAPGLFNYRAYLANQGIWYQLRVSSTNDWRPLNHTEPPFSTHFIRWAQATLSRGLPTGDQSLQLLLSMTLGWRTGITNEVYAPFMQTGTMHIFAISGLHIALIAGILVALLRGVRVSRQWCGLVVIPLIWFYTGATGWQPSAIRSTLMMSLIIGGWSLNRPCDLLNSLAAAALVILLWQPEQLFQAGFQLSFFVVLSIALLTPPLQKRFDQWVAHDPLLPEEALPRWRRWLEPAARWLTLSFATSLAAWLGSLPLTMYYFHLFSPVTLLANLVVVPMSSASLASALGSLLCGGWLPWVGELFNHSAWFWMRSMVAVSEHTAQWPGAFWYVQAPGPLDFVVYYSVLLVVLSGVLWQPGRRRWLGVLAVAVVTFYVGKAWLTPPEVRLTVLPLQGGSATFLEDGRTDQRLLLDCGNTNSASFTTVPFLRARGVNRLEELVLTHGDLKCVGGTEYVREQLGIERLVTSPVRFRSRVYRELVADADANDARRLISAGDTLGPWQVLHPQATNHFPQADDNALVLRAEFHGTRVLWLSDLGNLGQDALASRETNLTADIVIAGLPDRSSALTYAFLKTLRPQLVIVMDSEYPAPRRASTDLTERLDRAEAPYLLTRRTGPLEVCIRPNGWEVRNPEGRVWPRPQAP
jgi:ComEC/Rec2-related protein